MKQFSNRILGQAWRLILTFAMSTFAFSISQAQSTWSQCATENGYCRFSGTRNVRYGADSRWAYKQLSNGTACTNSVFGDPAYGTQKVCQLEPVTLPDLVVKSLSQNPLNPLPGQAVTFSAVIQNLGTRATPTGATIGIAFHIDGVPVTWSGYAGTPLAAGASMTLTANGGPTGSSTWKATSGNHTLMGFVNDVSRFPEVSMANNQLTKNLLIGTSVTTTTLRPVVTTTTLRPVVTTTTVPMPPSGSGLTINQVISDMSSPSEALVINPTFGFHYKPAITQHSPAGSSIASWWTGERPTWCYGLMSWYTLYEAQGNTSTNTRVEVKNLRVYLLSNSTRQWTRRDLAVAPNTGLWQYPFDGAGQATRKMEADGGVSFRPAYPNFMHGYGTGNNNEPVPNPSDVRAVFVAIDMKLVVADPTKPDDRANARYVVDSGADWYPDATYKMWSLGYAPGIANGRYLLATPQWRSATMLVPNFDKGATFEELRSNPPPLN